MTHFTVGEQVTIRWGKQEGQKGTIIKSVLADSYKVKIEDGSVAYFSGKGLEKKVVAAEERT
jgi:ribosomal protein L24